MAPSEAPSRRTGLLVSSVGLALLASGAVWWLGQSRPAPTPTPLASVVAPASPQGLSLFFAEPTGRALVPKATQVMWPGPGAGTEGVKAMVRALQLSPPGLQAAVPQGVAVREASYQAPHWLVELEVPAGLGGTGEQLLLGALVRSLLAATRGAEGVKLSLYAPDGKPYSGGHWDLSSPLTAADFMNEADPAPVRGLEATLWWPVKGGTALVPTKTVLQSGEGPPAKDAFTSWLAGPPGGAKAFLSPATPTGSTWRWEAWDSAGLAEVSVEGPTAPPEAELERSVRALVLTLTEWPGVKAVRVRHPEAGWPVKLGPLAWAGPLKRAEAAQGVEGAK